MKSKIIADSSLDMNDALEARLGVEIVPFKLYIDEEEMVDDKTLNINTFLSKMIASKGVPRTACPGPSDFIERIEEGLETFLIAISSQLSGTFNSAKLAIDMYKEEHPNAKIHVFDSKSASTGETLISMKIRELEAEGFEFEDVVEKVEKYIAESKTYFLSESLNNLIKNGRIPSWKGKLSMALKIMPIMGADNDGNIQLYGKARGAAKAVDKMVEIVKHSGEDFSNKTLAISHVDNPDRAEKLRVKFEAQCNFKEIVVFQTRGLSSLYCDNQGIILSF